MTHLTDPIVSPAVGAALARCFAPAGMPRLDARTR